jgi:tetraacyldisaccharide 4'-kinase
MSFNMSFKQALVAGHYVPPARLSPLLILLKPLSWLYGLGVRLRLWAYRLRLLSVYDAGIPVISVGNLTTGGTGKTPIVIEIAKGLVRVGKTVVILSRGYGASQPLAYGRASHPSHGDEAYMMQAQVPEAVVIVGRDRVATLKRAMRDYRPDYVLLDDGFQYLRLKRSMNILLIDGERLLGNECLLPVGPLREPLSEIRRATLILMTQRVTQSALRTVETWLQRACPSGQSIPVFPVDFELTGLRSMADYSSLQSHPIPFEQLRSRPVIAFCGVAHPQGFRQALHDQGFDILRFFPFADHYIYTQSDLDEIMAVFHQHVAEQPILVITDKDLPKVLPLLDEAAHAHLYTLQRTPHLDGRWFYDEFITQIPGFVKASPHAASTRPGA